MRRAEVNRWPNQTAIFFSEKVNFPCLKISFWSLVGYTGPLVLTKWESDSTLLLFPMKSKAV